MRNHLIPRKGRSYAKIMDTLKSGGVSDIATLAKASPALLQKAGISETETQQLLTQAQLSYNGQILKEIGIPAVSLKKYLAAGVGDPDAFCTTSLEVLSERTGMSSSTIQRHVAMVCQYLNKPVPKKYSKQQLERGKKQLLAIKGLSETAIEKLLKAGIIDADALLATDAEKAAGETGITAQKIRDYQAIIRKKRDNAVIQI